MPKPKKELSRRQKDSVTRSVKEMGLTSEGEACRALCASLGISVNTLKERMREDDDWRMTLEAIWEENSLGEGVKSVKKLVEVRDREYAESDYEGARLVVQTSGLLVNRADKVMERRSRVRELEWEVKRLEGEIGKLEDEVKRGGGGGGYVLPVYVVDLGDAYWSGLAETQRLLVERAREEAYAVVV